MIHRCRRLKMRTRIIAVPGERRRTGGSWAWPGWCLAENLKEHLINEEFDTRELDWVMREMHIIHLWVRRRRQSERTWRSRSIAGIIWSCLRLWITLKTIRPRGLECKVYRSKDSEHQKLARSLAFGGNSLLRFPPKIDVHVEVVPQGLHCLACHVVSCCATWWPPSSSKLWRRGIMRLENFHSCHT